MLPIALQVNHKPKTNEIFNLEESKNIRNETLKIYPMRASEKLPKELQSLKVKKRLKKYSLGPIKYCKKGANQLNLRQLKKLQGKYPMGAIK